jgi:diguanylate cyclase (GGDEF)-like protein/putative nucleotidyltransferase with HDIG domain
MGVSNALVWKEYPFASILTLIPLYLIYATLKVPALERQSETDPKTGLFNPKYFDRAIANELNRANRFDRPLTVVMADLDLLRHINNTYGHLAGDEVLIGVANIFKQSIREYDVVARFGGEEYVVLMPETTPQQAFFRVEMIREAIERAEFTVPTSVTPIKITMSFGVAGRESYNQAASDIVHNADAALYHAKLKGRNRTYIYTPDGYDNFFRGVTEETAQPAPAAVLETHAPGPESYAQPERIPPPVPTALNEEATSNGAESSEEAPNPAAQAVKSRPKWAVDVYIGGLALIATLLFAWLYRPVQAFDWLGLGIFSVLVILTEWMAVDIYVRSTAVSTSAAPILAGTLLYGPVGALVLSVSFALVALVKHRSRLSRFIFNASNQMIAGLIYTGLIMFSGAVFTAWSAPVQLLLTVFSSFVVYVLTTAPIAIAMDLDVGLPFRQVWQEQFSWLAPYYVTMGLIAYAFIFSYQNAGLMGVLVILVPLLLLRLSQKQYIDRTKVIVNELKEKNLKLERNTEEIIRLNEGLLNTLAELIDVRDPYVLGHSKQVAYLSVRIAQKMGLPLKQIDQLRKAGLLHDIGKLGISESILLKPTRLNPDEYDIVRGHAVLGSEILKTSHGLTSLVPIVRHHHERFDGTGYPDRLNSHDIPIASRIIAVADAFEAMASDRPYRKALGFDQILTELQRNSGSQFDPLIVKALIDIIRTEGETVLINSIGKSSVDTRI